MFQYQLKNYRTEYITEEYVSSPPALFVLDANGDNFTLGSSYQQQRDAPNGEFSFNVCRNGRDTGEYASRIEKRKGRIRIFTRQGYKYWTGRTFI